MAYRWLAALVLCVALARERAGAASAIGRYLGGLGLLIMAATTPIVLLVSRLFYRHCEAPWVRAQMLDPLTGPGSARHSRPVGLCC